MWKYFYIVNIKYTMTIQSSKIAKLCLSFLIWGVGGAALLLVLLEHFYSLSLFNQITDHVAVEYYYLAIVLPIFLYLFSEVPFREKVDVDYGVNEIVVRKKGRAGIKFSWNEIYKIEGFFSKRNALYSRQCWRFVLQDATVEVPVDISDSAAQVKLIEKFETIKNFNWQQYHAFYKYNNKLMLDEKQEYLVWENI